MDDLGPRIKYTNGAVFIRRCIKCGKFVKPDSTIKQSLWDGRLDYRPNAECKKCGRTSMIFEGFI